MSSEMQFYRAEDEIVFMWDGIQVARVNVKRLVDCQWIAFDSFCDLAVYDSQPCCPTDSWTPNLFAVAGGEIILPSYLSKVNIDEWWQFSCVKIEDVEKLKIEIGE